MAAIQLGWTLSGRLRVDIARDTFLNKVDEGFKIIDGHFDSGWFTDHLQYNASPVLVSIIGERSAPCTEPEQLGR